MMLPSALVQDAEHLSRLTVWDYLSAGGPVMVIFALCSVTAAGMIMERYLRLRRELVLPAEVRDLIAMAARGDRTQALDRAAQIQAPAARVLVAGLRREGLPLLDIERAMEDQAGKEADRLRGRIRALSLIATLAPLLGLLGTVIGLQEAFRRAMQVGLGKPEQLAGGIQEALVSTVSGLVIAITVMVFAAHLGARVKRLMHEVDDQLAPVVDAMAAAWRRAGAA